MSPSHLNMIMTFFISLTSLLLDHSHLMSSLLCLKGMLSLFILKTSLTSPKYKFYPSIIPIILLVFAAYEAAIGLSLLVMVSITYGLDHIQKLNLLQC